MTKKQRVIRYLVAHGFSLSPIQPSGRYETYSKHITDTNTGETIVITRHVGKAGGVRSGNKGITNSVSITEVIHQMVHEWEMMNDLDQPDSSVSSKGGGQ